MRARRRSPARFVGLAIIAMTVAVALLLVPVKGRSAPAEVGSDAAVKHPLRPKKAPMMTGADGDAGAGKVTTTAPNAAPPPPTPAPPAETDDALKSLPTGKGLPVAVNAALYFLELKTFDDNKGEFDCTTDLRLRWSDPRLRFPASETARGYKEFRGKAAEAQLEKMWTPAIDVTNRLESTSYVGRRVRISTNGDVETLTRVTARHRVHVDSERFPFDRQYLTLELLVREMSTDEVALRVGTEDVEFSRVARGAEFDGWSSGLVNLKADEVPGWNGDRYSRVVVTLFVDRVPFTTLAPIFIPLIASLLIPLLAIWMNRATDEGFEIPAFELANMGIGGLFSVIALSFAIYSAYGVIAGSDNTVTRLFGLNYVSLATALGVVVVFFRYNVLLRLFGPHVQTETFRFLTWALPLLSLATSVAFILVAAA